MTSLDAGGSPPSLTTDKAMEAVPLDCGEKVANGAFVR